MKKIVIYLFNCLILVNCNMNNSKYVPEKYFAKGDEFRLANAIYYDNESEVKFVINQTSIDINKPGKYGLTYLMYAIYCKQYSMVKLLLKLGANPNILSKVNHPIQGDNQDVTLRNKYTELCMPLPFVCGNPDWGMKYVKLLVENGADVNLANPFLPLNEVLVGGNADMKKIKYLMEHGADLNSFNVDGETPIIVAAMMRKLDIVEMFWEDGANPKHIDNDGASVAYWLQEDINKNLGTPKYIAHAKRIIERLKKIGVKFPVELVP